MLENSLKVLKMIESCGFKAYIVGGFVRDYLLGEETLDIDITTNARPMDIKKIFTDITLPNEEYGAITLYFKNYRFEITTFRQELSYDNGRRPNKIEYIDNLEDDLKRRDFKMNTLCMNSDGVILNFLGGKEDIENRVISTVGDPVSRFVEDPLRILRAVRFYTVLGFSLEEECKMAIKQAKYELVRVSYKRKRDELDKIFSSSNAKRGLALIKELDLDDALEIYNIDEIILDNDLVGIWSTLNVSSEYPFSSAEKVLIKNIKEVRKLDNLDNEVLYKYGLYVNVLAGNMKNISRKDITEKYESLPIKSKGDLKINGNDIMNILGCKPGKHLKEIINHLISLVLNGKLDNNFDVLKEYILENYRGIYE